MVLQVNELCAVLVPVCINHPEQCYSRFEQQPAETTVGSLILQNLRITCRDIGPRDCSRRVDNSRDIITMERSAVPFYRMIVVNGNSAAKRIDNFMDEVGDFRESLEPLMPDRT